MEIQIVENILQQVLLISEKYKQIAEITGETFNVFRILKVESKEVRMHSAILAELLNPKGSHGNGDVFLQLFVSSLKIPDFEAKRASIQIEEHIGFINDDFTEGGRVDIVIKQKHGQEIVIENKINAGDGYRQLVRYRNRYKNAIIYYLTLEGDEPEKESAGELIVNKDFFLLSYKSDILEWLRLCQKEAAVQPSIRETITQYIGLIKFLTGQSIISNMEREIVLLIGNNEKSIQASFDIANSMDSLKHNLIANLKRQIVDNIPSLIEHYPVLEYEISDNFGHKDSEISFWKKDWQIDSAWKYYISYYFDGYFKDFFLGVWWNAEKEQPQELKNMIFTKLNNFRTGKNSHSWAWYCYYGGTYQNWNNHPEPWVDVHNGKMNEKINDELIIVLKSLDEIGL